MPHEKAFRADRQPETGPGQGTRFAQAPSEILAAGTSIRRKDDDYDDPIPDLVIVLVQEIP